MESSLLAAPKEELKIQSFHLTIALVIIALCLWCWTEFTFHRREFYRTCRFLFFLFCCWRVQKSAL